MFQVPEDIFPRPGSKGAKHGESKLKFTYTEEPFSFKVSRKDGDVLFDSSANPLIFESQYIHLRTKLPEDPALYGLGQHTDPFRLNTTNYVRPLWSADAYGIPDGTNIYGSHPVYIEHRETGTHGVFLLNANGMDIMIDKDDKEGQFLEYNALGGVFDLWFFAGPDPADVSRQYAEVAGLPTFSPYWGLGFHQCHYGYRDAFEVAEVVQNYSDAKIPLETMWTDIEYMDSRLIFTNDPERYPLQKFRSLVSTLHSRGQKYIVMVDPAVGYKDNYPALDRGAERNLYFRRENGSYFQGVVWPGVTLFPDWFHENTTEWWIDEFKAFFDADEGIDIDGLWIDMNDPASFCNFPCEDPEAQAVDYPPVPAPVRENPRSLEGWPCEFQRLDEGGCKVHPDPPRNSGPRPSDVAVPNPPESKGNHLGLADRDLLFPKYSMHNYRANDPSWNADKGGLSNKTLFTNLISENGLAQYDTHNLYGHMMNIASREAMLARRPGKRPLVITRGTFPGSGAHVGQWLGDNLSTWHHYRAQIRMALAYTSIFQIPTVGSDVCGFGGNTTEELCARWASLGAFNPFFRNHYGDDSVKQEFFVWKSVTESARKAIDIRYRLLDYLYTAMHKASTDGSPIATPVFYQYPKDKNTLDIETSFFYGPGVLVAPVTEEGATSVDVYLPEDTFYDWYTHERIEGKGEDYTFDEVDITHIPLLIKSGVILPLREESANTTTELRKKNFEFLIALDDNGEAEGELYLDDGESFESDYSSLKLSYSNGELSVKGHFGFKQSLLISKITVLGGEEDGGDGCKAPQAEGVKASFSKKVAVSLNGPSTTPAKRL